MRNCREIGILLALAGVAAAAACGGHPGPDPAALRAYTEAHGKPTPRAAPVLADAGHPNPPPERAAPEPRAPEPARRVRLTVLDGKGLYDADDGFGETDAFVTLEVEGERFKTSVVEGSLEPVWGDSFVFEGRPGGVLTVTLFDSDVTTDERLGVVSLPLPPLAPGQVEERELAFRDGAQGTVRVRFEGLRDTPQD